MNRTTQAILRLDKWVNGKPEISIHNQWFIVDRVGLDLGKATRVRDLDGWIVRKIVPNKYVVVASPEGEEHDLAIGYRVDIDDHIAGRNSMNREAQELVKAAKRLVAGPDIANLNINALSRVMNALLTADSVSLREARITE